MTDEEELEILERAEWFYEMGIPGGFVGASLFILAFFMQDQDMLATGAIILAISAAAVKVGQYYKDKVLS